MSSGSSNSTILTKLPEFWSITVILSSLFTNSKICGLSESGFNACFTSSLWIFSLSLFFFFFSFFAQFSACFVIFCWMFNKMYQVLGTDIIWHSVWICMLIWLGIGPYFLFAIAVHVRNFIFSNFLVCMLLPVYLFTCLFWFLFWVSLRNSAGGCVFYCFSCNSLQFCLSLLMWW